MNRIDDLWDDRLFVTRARAVPIVSTIAGSATALLPMVAQTPALPPFGLLMLLGWRLLRPEMWQAWVALPLGLADDLIGGQPLGSAMALWTLCFLMLDIVDNRLVWRDYWVDWLVAAIAIIFCIWGGWSIARFTGGGGAIFTIGPQIAMSVFCFPAIVRICAALDHWRLSR
ncbi:rod shape-determining protein MreD [Sphingomonas oleivorans]|uniref:Rod shape-determining protein MreD n=1 Tax=Sphingomonas oleivorans TaxID=1735121 RepID=A0A2T5FWC6_9SPHN|nr:rod shape-determining protein MreD [Sphingomonas oleivorans]PTQ10088.1 rod shape-determining protein MreD [Sphingomonas oleivorans]